MSLTTSFKESEVPAWIKERLRTWHTQLFTDLDYVDFYSPSCRQDILKRFSLPHGRGDVSTLTERTVFV